MLGQRAVGRFENPDGQVVIRWAYLTYFPPIGGGLTNLSKSGGAMRPPPLPPDSNSSATVRNYSLALVH